MSHTRIEVIDNMWGGKNEKLDDSDMAKVAKDLTYNNKDYKAGDSLNWGDPLYVAAREEYQAKYKNEPPQLYIPPYLRNSPPTKPRDIHPENAENISKYLRLWVDGAYQEISADHHFIVGDTVGFYVGHNPNSVIEITGSEGAALVIEIADSYGMASTHMAGGRTGHVNWIFKKAGTYTINYNHSGGSGSARTVRGSMTIQVAAAE